MHVSIDFTSIPDLGGSQPPLDIRVRIVTNLAYRSLCTILVPMTNYIPYTDKFKISTSYLDRSTSLSLELVQ
jgi:hypothetical protein